MRCGKAVVFLLYTTMCRRNPHECAVAKTVFYPLAETQTGRNPHECAVAKPIIYSLFIVYLVATRTNALWQSSYANAKPKNLASQPARMRCGKVLTSAREYRQSTVATRTNALWQSLYKQREYTKTGGRNPHECAVAKKLCKLVCTARLRRNPHECAVAKWTVRRIAVIDGRSQPARMRCGKAFI